MLINIIGQRTGMPLAQSSRWPASMNRFLNQTKGTVLVQFVINEYGEVIEPEIIDTFNIELNDAIIDKVMCIQFEPATQNGRPVKVRYNLPILFK